MSTKLTIRMVRSACILVAAVAAMTFFSGNANAQGCGYGGGGFGGGFGGGGYGARGVSIGIGSVGYGYGGFGHGMNVGYSSFRPIYGYGGGWNGPSHFHRGHNPYHGHHHHHGFSHHSRYHGGRW